MGRFSVFIPNFGVDIRIMTSKTDDIHSTIGGRHLRIDASHPHIAYVGRVKRDASGGVRFSLPGVQIHVRFVGASVAMEVAPYSGFFMVELDDRAPFKVKSGRCETVVEIADGLPWAEHRLTITYCNEGELAPPVFYGLLISSQGEVLERPELPYRRIEFIGDSITCGYGDEDFSADKAYPYPEVCNAYYSYASQTARLLRAQCMLVARSGICLAYDRHTPGVGVFHDMLTLYPYALFAPEHDSDQWNCSLYQPDVVCINLGTNDVEQPSFEEDAFAASMVRFVHEIRNRYAHAKIVLLSGPMLHGEQLASIKRALETVMKTLKNEGVTSVYRYDIAPMDGTLGYGTLGHPSLSEHTQIAQALATFLSTLLQW